MEERNNEQYSPNNRAKQNSSKAKNRIKLEKQPPNKQTLNKFFFFIQKKKNLTENRIRTAYN